MTPVRVSFWYEFILALSYRSVFELYWYEILISPVSCKQIQSDKLEQG